MLTNLFRRKPPPPLKEAISFINRANEIVMECRRNQSYQPDKADLALLEQIEHHFQEGYAATAYVHRCMQQRLDGESEGAAKFHHKEALDYHYPK